MLVPYTLEVLYARDIVWTYSLRHSRIPDLYVEVEIGGEIKRTKTVKKSKIPDWNDKIGLSSGDQSAQLLISIKHSSSYGWDPCIGSTQAVISDLLLKCREEPAKLSVYLAESGGSDPTGTICLRLVTSNIEKETALALQEAAQSSSALSLTSASSAFTSISDLVDKCGDTYETFGVIVDNLEGLVSFLDEASKAGAIPGLMKALLSLTTFILYQIHPYASITWQVASSAYKVIRHQFQTDKRVLGLVETMKDSFDFVRDTQELPNKIVRFEDDLILLLQQITECSIYIRNYSGQVFVDRMLTPGDNEKIDAFSESLTNLKKKIDGDINLQTAFVSARISQGVEEIIQRQVLASLDPSKMDTYYRPRCLGQTCISIRQELIYRLLSDDEENVIWLSGSAGCGKSTISMTVSDYLSDVSRLATYLFYERGKSSSDPSTVIRTLAYNLALFDSSLCAQITASLKRNVGVEKLSAEKQFEKLILQPIQTAGSSIGGPIVIILDALDECGNAATRKSLLQVLETGFAKLPKNFRILITSRPEKDIERCLLGKKFVHVLELDYTSPTSKQDVLNYLDHELRDLIIKDDDSGIPSDWPWDSNMVLLGEAAAGLFIWASTVIKLVSGSDDPFRKLEGLVKDTHTLSSFGLDELYSSVLSSSGISWQDPTSRDRCCLLFGILLFGKTPLTSNDIENFLGFSTLPYLSRLKSVLHYIPGDPVRLYHASFGDYLISLDRSKDPWFINIPTQKCYIANRCFEIMADRLSFNICGLTTSFSRNDDIDWLTDRIKEKIPSFLVYVCRNWARHLNDIPYSEETLRLLSRFLNTHLLFWFEVMSLLKCFDNCAWSLLDAIKWVSSNNSEIASFLADARRLVNQYFIPASQSVPHIYVSVLPFASKHSKVAAHYLKNSNSLTQVIRKGAKDQLSSLMVIRPDGFKFIYSIAFSRDGSRFYSGSHDGILRVWDAETGLLLSELQADDSVNDAILTLSASPNDKHVACGSFEGKIRVWDVRTGLLLPTDLEGHKDDISCLCYSPDGNRIVSSSIDKTICIWDSVNGRNMFGFLQAHTDYVQSLCFSPDGSRFASASYDGSIFLWDVARGATIAKPFEGHTNSVYSVAFSADGQRLVSGSLDMSVRIWDANTGDMILSPLTGHTQGVTTVAFSPDGSRIVSGSADNSVRVWNTKTGESSLGPFTEHTGTVWSVAFSPDGTRILSCSDDGTIRVWDSESSTSIFEPYKGHPEEILAVNFSSDGKLIASGSKYGIIQVWDFQSGKLVYEPIEGEYDICSIALSVEGSQILTGMLDGSICVWDAKEGTIVAGPYVGHSNSVLSVAFSTDGSLLYSGSSDGTQRIWIAESGMSVGLAEFHYGILWPAAISPDMKNIAYGSYDGATHICDASNGDIISGPFYGHERPIESIAFSPDGQYIVTGSLDGTIRVSKTEKSNTNESNEVVHSWTLNKDGWIVGKQNELLLWVPYALHRTLWRPQNTAVLNCAFSTKLDFAGSLYGPRWTECYESNTHSI